MSTRKASLVSVYSRHGLSRLISQACFCLTRHDLFKTRSVQDTICQDTFTMLVSVSHPMSTSPLPVIEYVASVSAITYTALSPVTEYVAPAPAVTYAATSWDIDYVSHSN